MTIKKRTSARISYSATSYGKTKTLLLTTLGILLSFAVALGGWQLVNRLIGMESDRLLGTPTTFAVDMPDMPLSDTSLAEDDAPHTLDKAAITSILRNWEDMGFNRWHEPAPGQITMEQAILTAREWVAFLQSYNLLPADIGFTSQVAFLSQNTDPMGSFLPLEYSYWTVNFGSDDIHLHMQMNAVTGQVWTTEVTVADYRRMLERSYHLSHDEMQDALTAYMALLGMDGALDTAHDYLLFQQDWFFDRQGAMVLVENIPWVARAGTDGVEVFFENSNDRTRENTRENTREDTVWVSPPTVAGEAITAVETPPTPVFGPLTDFRRRVSIAYPIGDDELMAVISVFGMPDFDNGVYFNWLTIGLATGIREM